MKNPKSAALAILAVMSFSASSVLAGTPEEGKWGLGISAGAPLSVTGKYYLSETTAVDAHIGAIPFISEGFHGSMVIAGDYLMEFFEIVDARDFRINFYGGAGAALFVNAGGIRAYDQSYEAMIRFYQFGIGARFPGGLGLQLKTVPVEVHLELSPTAAILFPDPSLDQLGISFGVYLWNLALGVRYYFE